LLRKDYNTRRKKRCANIFDSDVVMGIYEVMASCIVSKLIKVGHEIQGPMSWVRPSSLLFQKVQVQIWIRRVAVTTGLS
jgi:hypothetical protein